MIRPPNLESMEIDCPECDGKAKYVKPSLKDRITGKPRAGYLFKCKKCKHEFSIVF